MSTDGNYTDWEFLVKQPASQPANKPSNQGIQVKMEIQRIGQDEEWRALIKTTKKGDCQVKERNNWELRRRDDRQSENSSTTVAD